MVEPRKNIIIKYIVNIVLYSAFMIIGTILVDGGVISEYYSKVVLLVGINIILALSLNLAAGFLGQLPLGHAGFMAVGAYTSAIFVRRVSMDSSGAFVIGIILGGLVAALIGFLIGIPALRLKGDYMAIITLGFGEIIRVVIINIDDVLGFDFTYGASNMKNIPKTTTFLNCFLCVGITVVVMVNLIKSKTGRAILSVRENEIAAEACGVNVTGYKELAFTISAFFAGVAGALYSGYLGILNPSAFGFSKSIDILVTVVLGGMGSMTGSVLAAVFLTVVPELLRGLSKYRMIVYSLLLIIVMIYRPSGLMGSKEFSTGNIINRIMSRRKAVAKDDA
ncbi:MAG: branched-chain amino acid ABC transporter permease [Oscillospiraceae bacterium]|jgi:branched-chain amino acid transport system permease protein